MHTAPFILEARRHTKTSPHALNEAFRPLTDVGHKQLDTLTLQMRHRKFHKIFYTPAAATAEFAHRLHLTGRVATNFELIEGIFPPVEQNWEIWKVFHDVPNGNAPADFADHPLYSFYRDHCARAASMLTEICQGHSNLLIAHKSLIQGIFAQIARIFFKEEIATEIEQVTLNEGDGLIIKLENDELSFERLFFV